MRRARLLAAAVLFLGLVAASADAGVLIVSESTSFAAPDDKETFTFYLDRDRMRVETKGPEGSQIIIFRNDQEVFWVIDQEEGAYFEMTRKSMQEMLEGMEESASGGKDVREMLAEQMKGLSPEERKMMEQMGAPPMAAMPPKPVYKKTASSLTVGRWTCDKYEGYQRGVKTEEVCAADLKELGLAPEDFTMMEEMEKFTESLAVGEETAGPKGWQAERGYPGFPVREVSFLRGRMEEQMELKDIQRQTLPASLFELPEGLKKMEHPLSGGMGSR